MFTITKLDISVFIITLNEEKYIYNCLKSVEWASEIIIVDSGSTDRTLEICKGFNCNIYHRNWTGFADQKQFAFDLCTNEWCLNIDADERVSSEGFEELKSAIACHTYDGYSIPMKNIMFGKWMRHNNLYPDFHIRLVKKNKSSYKSQEVVHESLIVRGKVGFLSEPLIHFTLNSYSHRINKSNQYSTLTAKMSEREPESIRYHEFLFHPIKTFFGSYVKRKGILDGTQGLIFSLHQAFAEFAVLVKIWEKQFNDKKTE